MEEIRECPFCGSKVLRMEEYAYDKFFIRCSNCKAEGPVDVDTMAVAKWNLPPRPGETVELPKDMDGARINIGDTVYLDDGEPMTVVKMSHRGSEDWSVCMKSDRIGLLWERPDKLTHVKPDDWEEIEYSIRCVAGYDYFGEDQLLDDEVEKLMERIKKVARK